MWRGRELQISSTRRKRCLASSSEVAPPAAASRRRGCAAARTHGGGRLAPAAAAAALWAACRRRLAVPLGPPVQQHSCMQDLCAHATVPCVHMRNADMVAWRCCGCTAHQLQQDDCWRQAGQEALQYCHNAHHDSRLWCPACDPAGARLRTMSTVEVSQLSSAPAEGCDVTPALRRGCCLAGRLAPPLISRASNDGSTCRPAVTPPKLLATLMSATATSGPDPMHAINDGTVWCSVTGSGSSLAAVPTAFMPACTQHSNREVSMANTAMFCNCSQVVYVHMLVCSV